MQCPMQPDQNDAFEEQQQRSRNPRSNCTWLYEGLTELDPGQSLLELNFDESEILMDKNGFHSCSPNSDILKKFLLNQQNFKDGCQQNLDKLGLKRKKPGPFRNGAVLGGILRLIGYAFLVAYGIDESLQVIYHRKYDYHKREYYWSEAKLAQHPANLGKYNDSMNFAFGVSHREKDFDIFNNSYVEPIAYVFEHA